ncbi:LPXTG cell wall anchor domain-containing protein [Salinibacterium sp. NG253]|uniref:DUF7507 domain-containing protein n=1 Tax=Salinibacterium sp. NG253 TaxID=2792039 RepID=UPI0018CD984C|nr:LPXTG cell wall anchor domain-containing protein [Salinibacterium sp. NG253]MBH0117669.1 LPXTG cell wall anchor domain-containing protein [Salinibacterium sp. NG253]
MKYPIKTAFVAALATSLVALVATPASAATYSHVSAEASGNNIAGRAAATTLRDAWGTAVTARGGTVPAPLVINGTQNDPLSGVIATTPGGTTVSVERTMYTPGATTTLVGVSPNPGIAQCTGSGNTLQSSSPRPSLLDGNSGCTNGAGFSYGASGGNSQEANTRDAFEFTFSADVLAFGGWFGDLETRTDGSGVPALVRLYDTDDLLISEEEIVPSGDQSLCGTDPDGCGNRSTRWIGFTADLATPVSRMVVIVGDEHDTGTAVAEGMSFIGPSVVDGTANLTIAKTATALPATASQVGDLIDYSFLLTNTGTLALSNVTVNDAGAQNLSCPANTLAAGATMTCAAEHAVTQDDIDAGSYTNSATASGETWGETVTSAADTATTAANQAPALDVAQSADTTTYTAVGDTATFTVSAHNTGNTTLDNVVVTSTLPTLAFDCSAMPTNLAPGATGTCTAILVVTDVGADFSSIASVASDQLTLASDATTVRFAGALLPATGSDATNAALAATFLLLAGSTLLAVRRSSALRPQQRQRAPQPRR